MEFTWNLHGVYMEFTWSLHGVYMKFKWSFHGVYMEFTWSLHGLYMKITWICTILCPSKLVSNTTKCELLRRTRACSSSSTLNILLIFFLMKKNNKYWYSFVTEFSKKSNWFNILTQKKIGVKLILKYGYLWLYPEWLYWEILCL